jgi:hypothetical protein
VGRNIHSDKQIKIKDEVNISVDSRSTPAKKKPVLREFMQHKIATQMRADAAFIRSKK